MNSLSINNAIKIAVKSFDWVLRNKDLLITFVVGALILAGISSIMLSYYPGLVVSYPYRLLLAIGFCLFEAWIMFYAKNQFDGKGSSLLAAAQQLAQRFFQIAPAIILIAGIDAISSHSMTDQWGMIPSLLVKAASFVVYTLALYLLSIAVNHHGSFISTIRHWLNRIPEVAPAALAGRVMFLIFAGLIGFVAVGLAALIIFIQSWIMSAFISTTLGIIAAFLAIILFAVIFAAQSYFFSALGWFSVHNKLPEQIENKVN